MSSIANIENKESGESVRGKLNNAIGKINNLGSAANVDTGTNEGNVPALIANGKLPDSTIPSLAISRTFEVADDAGRDALDGVQEGDVAIVESSALADGLSASYIWTGTEWVKMRFPKDPAIHDQNTDTKLAGGTDDEVSANELRTHVDDADKHREINDAGSAATDLWSADKIGTELGGKVDTEEGKGLSANDYTNTDKSRVDLIQDDSLPPNVVQQNQTHRFVTDTEKSDWNNKVDQVEGKDLSDENYTSAEKSKLAGLESSKFLGQFASLNALQTEHPSPAVGSYAYVDEGENEEVVKYIWDSSDNEYVAQLGESAEETPATIKQKYEENADTNAFTDNDQTKLGGIEAGAQVNQADAQIKAQYEANDNTNAYTDADAGKVANVPADTNAELAKKANRKATIGRTITESGELENGDVDAFAIVDSGTEVTLTIPAEFMDKGQSATFYQAGIGNIKLVNTDGEAATSGEGQTVTLLCIKDDPETYLTTGDAVWGGY